MATTQTAGNGKGKAAAQAPVVPVRPASKALVIPTVKPGAMSKDIGPMVISQLDKVGMAEKEAQTLLKQVATKRYDLLAQMTLAIVKASQNDKGIDLSATFEGAKDARKSVLNAQIGVALGFREVMIEGEGDKQTQRVVYAKSVRQYFPSPDDKKDSPEAKRKETLRSNFAHSLAQCMKAAAGIVERGIKARYEPKAGTLLLEGKAVKEQFGQDKVLLNEKQKLTPNPNKPDDTVELKEKPSFTAISARAVEDHGGTAHRGSNTRGKGAATARQSPEQAFVSVCNSLVSAIGKVKEFTKPMKEAMDSVYNAIDAVKE